MSDLAKKFLKNKKYKLSGKTYKKTTRGFDPDYAYSELLLRSGFYVYYESKDFSELTKKDPASFSYKTFREMYFVHKWFVENIV